MTTHQRDVLTLLADGAVVRREPGQGYQSDRHAVYAPDGSRLRGCRYETWHSLTRRDWARWQGGGVVDLELRITDDGRQALARGRPTVIDNDDNLPHRAATGIVPAVDLRADLIAVHERALRAERFAELWKRAATVERADVAQTWACVRLVEAELDGARAENARLREALVAAYAHAPGWHGQAWAALSSDRAPCGGVPASDTRPCASPRPDGGCLHHHSPPKASAP